MVNTNHDKWAIGDSILFPAKHKAPYLIPYYYKVELDSLLIPDDNDHIDDNGITLYEKPLSFYWIIEVCLPQGEKVPIIR